MIGKNPATITPAQRLADTIVEQRNLHPPVPVDELVREVADVREARLRGTGLDAVLHGLQSSGTPTLLIDEDAPETRRRFTMGHEFGHLSMAWHQGTLRCLVGTPEHGDEAPPRTTQLLHLETDANEFASRLLIPRRYVQTLDLNDLEGALQAVTQTGVSAEAAIYGLVSYLPPGRMLILLDAYGTNIYRVAKSFGTVNLPVLRERPLDEAFLAPFIESCGHTKYRGSHIFWAKLLSSMTLTSESTDWRPVLTAVLNEYELDATPSGATWRSVNGVASAAHSAVGHTDVEALAMRIKQVFQRHETFSALAAHPLFDEYVSRRARAFAAPKTTRRN